MMGPIKVLCVDDHSVVRAGLRSLLRAEPGFVHVGETGSGEEAITLADALKPDVIIMDIRLADGDGVETSVRILSAHPLMKILILTSFAGDEAVHRAFEAGARGFLLKEHAESALVTALRDIGAGRHYVSPDVAQLLWQYGPRVKLTNREHETLGVMAEGLRNKDIARRLNISVATARAHVESVRTKFQCADRQRAIAVATERGFLISARPVAT